MTIDVTVSGASSNSYVTIAEADLYFTTRLRSDAWTTAPEADKESALRMATIVLDTRVKWQGNKWIEHQSLQWPRYYVKDPYSYDNYVYYLDPETLPSFIKTATFEQAISLIEGDTLKEYDTKGLQSLSVGEISLVFNSRDRPLSISRQALELIRPYAEEIFAGSPSRAKLWRV